MKITVTNIIDTKDDGRDGLEIAIDDLNIFGIAGSPECPEDFTLSRDLRDVEKIPDMMKRAHEAGKRGEPFEIEIVNVDR